VIQTKPESTSSGIGGERLPQRIRSWRPPLERLPLDRRPALAIAAALIVIAFGLRFAEMGRATYRPTGDATSYLQLGSTLATSGSYRVAGFAAGGTRGPTAYFPPAYPYLIAAVDEVTGLRGAATNTVRAQQIAQVAVGTIVVVLVGLTAYELFGITAGLTALAIATFYPPLIELSTVMVAENLLTMLTLAAVYSALRALRDHGRLRWLIACGIFVGLATLAHTNAILLVLPLAFAMTNLAGVGKSRRIAGPLALVGVTLITLLPWLIRDQVVMNRFIPVSDEAGIALVGTYNKASPSADPPYRSSYYANLSEFHALAAQAHNMTEPQLSSRLVTKAADYIGEHPAAPLAAAWHNTLRLLELEGSFAWRASAASIGISAGAARIGVIGFWVLALLALAGAFTKMARGAPRWVWAVPVLMALSVVFINAETPRFREPIDVFLILLATCAIASLLVPLVTLVKNASEPPHYDVAKRINGV
jgi:4-amino-4-deoxy-L-arabinose transferase-like glycosyltransferase